MMDSSKQKVLITRPIEDAKATQDLLQQHGIDADYQPFLSVTLHDVQIDINQYSALIFTSRNAVRAYCNSNTQRSINTYCVGDRTAELCQEHGFESVQSASGTVQDLQALLAQQKFAKPALYLRGKDISSPLTHPNISEVVMYETTPITVIESDIKEKIRANHYSDILFFSTRTAKVFTNYITLNNLKNNLKSTKALCLAEPMIESLSVLPWKEILVADQPTQVSLLKLLKE